MTLSLDDVLKATGGTLLHDGPTRFNQVETDTRSLTPGALYVPIKGARFDGHDFVDQAVRLGAGGVLLARDGISTPGGVSAIRVQDTRAAYGDLARHHREQLGLQVVAVAGSSGKTSTKEMIAALLARYLPVGKSHANFNNEIGVPRTLLAMRRQDKACVLEMGMRGPGEIAYLASVARPDIGVITNIGTAHLGRLGTQEAIARAKGELLRVGGPTMAAALNYDDPLVMGQAAEHLGRVATFSLRDATATVWAQGEGRTFRAHYQEGDHHAGGTVQVHLPYSGPHHRANALAALTVAWLMGLELPRELELTPEELPGRQRVLRFGGLEVVDETYNANPESVLAALAGFCADPCRGKRVVVLGEMGELGTYSEVAHRTVGSAVRDADVARLIAVGPMARWIAEQVPERAEWVEDNRSAVEALEGWVQPGDRILVKGSRSARMEEVIDGLQARLGEESA